MNMTYIYVILVLLLIIFILLFKYRLAVKQQRRYKLLYRSMFAKFTEEKHKNQEQLLLIAQQNRLAQKGEMVNIIAHQWRQPLNTLSILLERINRFCHKDDNVFKNLYNQMTVTIQHMALTIDEFSNFFKPEKHKEEFFIDEILDKTLKLLRPALIEENINLISKMDKSIKFIGYPNELGQALINLINNAKEAFSSKDINHKEILVELTKDRGIIRITICDNAGGIKADLLDKIFEPYISTKNKKQGIGGLGLYISRLVIQEHMNGELYVENTKDGAKFTIEFRDNNI